ncbi:acetyltransferase [Citrobacter farmeri]|uniref:acetyltransferase n=1 Tax=Citrobacter farmeri TaxID=67824 RepID=UPI00292CF7F1|nr:acetyltransferase [Citrobacter farmeri]
MVINIRRSRHDEGEKLIAIWCRSVDATHDFLSKEYRVELEKLVRSFLPEAPLWVAANEQDEPVAFMLLTGDHMDALFVDPDVRGRGVGKLLIKHALSLAPALTTNVNEQNEQAVGFYKKMGFWVTGRAEVDDLGRPYPLLHLRYHGGSPCLQAG